MKREIEFRGKTAKGEWVYGSFINSVVRGSPFGYIAGNNVVEPIQVMRKTVGQYVGIKDKNGKKVYEGDIVYCSYCNCEVIFGVYGACDYKTVGFFMKGNEALFTDEEDNFVYWGFEDGDKIEVLGNVFDNPELLNKIEYKGESNNGD